MTWVVKLTILIFILIPPFTQAIITDKIFLDVRNLDWPQKRSRGYKARNEIIPGKNVIWNVEIWRDWAFYCIPRWSDGVVATLVSSKWNPEHESPLLHPFPNWSFQSSGDACHGFQSVTAVAADTIGRLWVLDAGDDVHCRPKIVVFDLADEKLSGKEVARHVVTIPEVSGKNLLHLVVDWGALRSPRAYASDAGEGSILVYSIKDNACWRVHTGVKKGVGDMSVSYFYLSLFFVTMEESDQLFQIDLIALRKTTPSRLAKTEATKVGNLSGNTTTVAVDKRGGIIYFVPKTNAVRRWNTIGRFDADKLLYLDDNALPKVPRIIFDSHNFGWALANSFQRKSNVTSTLTRIYDPLM